MNSDKLKHYSTKTEVLKNSYFTRTIPQWNNTPDQTVYSLVELSDRLAELGRLPLRHHIIVAMLKYQFRYLIMNDNELISQAFLSQAKLTRNSSNTITYAQVCQSLKTSLGVNESSSDINNTVLIHNIK